MIRHTGECLVFSMIPVRESSTEWNSFFSLRGKTFLWGAGNWTQMILMGPFQLEMFSDSIGYKTVQDKQRMAAVQINGTG